MPHLTLCAYFNFLDSNLIFVVVTLVSARKNIEKSSLVIRKNYSNVNPFHFAQQDSESNSKSQFHWSCPYFHTPITLTRHFPHKCNSYSAPKIRHFNTNPHFNTSLQHKSVIRHASCIKTESNKYLSLFFIYFLFLDVN